MTRLTLPAFDPKGERPQRTTNAMQIHADLRHRIVTGALRPMQCLSESELADSLGVSRTPVREALSKLEEESLVEIRPRLGTFVSPIRPAAVMASQFVREALECTAVARAALDYTPVQRPDLDALIDAQHAAADDNAFFLADDAFHRGLMAIAGQRAAWGVVHSAKAVIDRVRFLSVQRLTNRKATIDDHQHIAARVIAGDPVGAADAMRDHLSGVFISIEISMAANPEFFAWDENGPRPNRHRPRQIREAIARQTEAITPPRAVA